MIDARRLITGEVSDAKGGLPDIIAELWAGHDDRNELVGEARTDADGHFAIRWPSQELLAELSLKLMGSERSHVLASVPLRTLGPLDIRLSLPTGTPTRNARARFLATIADHSIDRVAAAGLSRAELLKLHDFLSGRRSILTKRLRAAFPTLSRRRRGPLSERCAGERGQLSVILMSQRGWLDADILSRDNDLPEPLASWSFHYTANVEVAYTLDDVSLPDHALTGAAAQPPAPALPATEVSYALNNGTANIIVLGQLSTSLAFLNAGVPGAPNLQCAPALVQQISLLAEYALARYQAFGLRSPRAPGERLKVRVCDITYGGVGYPGETQPYWDHLRVNHQASQDQIEGTVPHEVFHRVQFRYNPSIASGTDMQIAVREGGARLAEDCVNTVPNRYIRDADPLFNEPWRSIVPFTNSAGTSYDGFDYEAGVFWKYIAEQDGHATAEPAIGIDAYREIMEATATIDASGIALAPAPGMPFGYDPTLLRTARAQLGRNGDFDRFLWCDTSRTELSTHETTWGNFAIANILHGTPAAVGDARFRYLEDHDPVPAHAQLGTMHARVPAANAVSLSAGIPVIFPSSDQDPPWGIRYYRIVPNHSVPPGLVRIALAATGTTPPLTQIVLLTPANALQDIHRFDQGSFSKTINMTGLGVVFVVVANRNSPGQHTLTVTPVAPGPLVTATRWNTAQGTSYEVDPRSWSWTWTSPDIMVDTDNDLLADTYVFFGRNNSLKLRITNHGNGAANAASVSFWYQKASPSLSPSAWIPVTDVGGNVQTVILPGPLAAGASQWLTVQWAPVDDGTHQPHWCVKAQFTATGDPNSDDKIVLSNFSNLTVQTLAVPFWLMQTARPVRGMRNMLHVVSPARTWRQANSHAVDLSFNGGNVRGPGIACSCGSDLLHCHDQPSLAIGISLSRGMASGNFPPVHPGTLPPGVPAESVVTIMQTAGGLPIGGVTYRLLDGNGPPKGRTTSSDSGDRRHEGA
jgi:hypothetical protein